MQTKKLFFLVAAFAIVFSACDEIIVQEQLYVNDFEDLELPEEGYYNGSDLAGKFEDGNYVYEIKTGKISLVNIYIDGEWGGFWKGFAASAWTDATTAGYMNQYSAVAGSGANASEQFVVAYDTAVVKFTYEEGWPKAKSMMMTNTTYAYFDMLDGSSFSKKFAAGDWYKVKIHGFLDAEATGVVDFYLADFRDGKSILVNEWVKVDLSSLGTVSHITLSFDSSDKGMWGVNTPKYVCVDNLEIALP